jgi:hypothetical protein
MEGRQRERNYEEATVFIQEGKDRILDQKISGGMRDNAIQIMIL